MVTINFIRLETVELPMELAKLMQWVGRKEQLLLLFPVRQRTLHS